jgi:hypothetical protein
VAALIPEACAARAEARRLRADMAELRLATRESADHSLEQRRTAEAALTRITARRSEPLPSPWSTLRWSCDATPLSGVLVAIR